MEGNDEAGDFSPSVFTVLFSFKNSVFFFVKQLKRIVIKEFLCASSPLCVVQTFGNVSAWHLRLTQLFYCLL